MFGIGKNSFLGIDVGTSTVKAVEIKVKNKKPVLSNYAWIDLDAFSGKKEKLPDLENIWPAYLKKLIKESKIKSRNAYVSIPAFGGLITLIEFPEMSKGELDQAIKFEAHKYIPTSLDDIVLSWDIVGMKGETKLPADGNSSAGGQKIPPAKKVQVLLVAAPKTRVVKSEKLIKDIGLDLKSIEIESFAMVRSLVGNDQGNFVIADIGARVCNIALVEKGIIKVNRNIDAGGREITKTIARSFDIDEERAEEMKISGRNFLEKETKITFPSLENITGEIKRVLSAYYKNDQGIRVDGIILSGGTANLKGLENYFSNALQIKTTIGNPLGRIEYDKKLDPKLVSLRPKFSVAVGLALKGVEEYLKK